MKNRLQEINKQAALNASKALSKLVDQQVSVDICEVAVKKVEGLNPIIGPEEIIAGIYLPVTGDIQGAS
jgi:chemotaxis protein CheY-P-specific phosphatase CheC